jgi:osmoprotectant transport system permease protein
VILGQERPVIEWDWIARNLDDIWAATVEHVAHTVLAVTVGLIVSVALSLVALRWRRTYALGLTSVLTAQIALVSYTLLILIRNIVAGVDGVPRHLTEASMGMGMTGRAVFLRVQLPLAMPVIVAGIRVAAVTTIGLVTLTVLVGQGGYGVFILRGINRQFLTEALVGTVLSVLLALVVDTGLGRLERRLTPWARPGP